jgi:Flp pilus assembly protein TadD
MKKIGRNDPCRCGSGKKYKHCHQASDEAAAAAHGTGPKANNAGTAAAGAAVDPAAAALVGQLAAQGGAWLARENLEQAAASFRQALALAPDRAELHSNLGYVLERQGRIEAAVASYRKAVSLKPGAAELHSNLGLALQAQGGLAQAEASFRRAVDLNPDYAGAHFNLARLLQLQGRHQEAVAPCRRVVALSPGDAQAHNNLGVALEELGQFEAAIACYRQALALDPGLVSAQKGIGTALGRLVPDWHVPMMNDTLRNEAYYAALRAAVTPESHVFEIGTGSGLLAMMAARLGAASVVTCEAVTIIAGAAARIVADNGLAGRVTVVAKKSTELAVGAELAQRADIMVSEILSTELLGERVLDSIEDAKRRLLKPGARVIPAAGSLMIALFGGARIATNLAASQSCGFDLRHFNTIVPRRQPIARNDLPVEMLSAATPAFRFDFEGTAYAPPEAKTLRIPVTAAGECLGIVQWIRLEMFGDMVFENHPDVQAPASAWTRCAYLLPAPLQVLPGQVALVAASHNRVFPWFNLTGFE